MQNGEKRIWRKLQRTAIKCLLLLLGAVFCAPILFLLSGSIMSRYELRESLLPLMADTDRLISWRFLPFYPTFGHYAKILFQTPQFFIVFWNSMKITVAVLLGQLVIAVPAAWAFAVFYLSKRKKFVG